MFWLKSLAAESASTLSDDGSVVNLVSYEDAARAATKVLQHGLSATPSHS